MPQAGKAAPIPFDDAKADDIVATLREVASGDTLSENHVALARGITGNSPYLASLARRFPTETITFLTGDPHAAFEAIIDDLAAPRLPSENEADFMAYLRDQKSRAALLVAIADIGGKWQLTDVTDALSRLAKAMLELSLARALRLRHIAGDLPWPAGSDASSPIRLDANAACQYFLLGMGKLGGNELNYSSDIDLIALFDPTDINYCGRKSIGDCFVKLTQDVVRFMDQRTMHGYVFRVDLRLRPDPGATPVALSIDAAQTYYYSIAANWERAAMIKAAFAAGDADLATQYLEEMSSWVWRRNMDFEALKDISAIKNQINRHYQTEDATFRGFDVKLGVGGIREIEFYAQVNQLLHAGRQPSLRTIPTLETLERLCEQDLIPRETVMQLSEAYLFLRTVEHRIQMLNDEQTHAIPEDEAPLQQLVNLLGFETHRDFETTLKAHTSTVSTLYDNLLPGVAEDDFAMSEPQLLEALTGNGFSDIDGAKALIDNWQLGRYRSLKTTRARDLLNQCLPDLLTGFAQTQSPDAALTRFDGFIAQLPAGVQLFSLLKSNRPLLGLLTRLVGLAPALASLLAKEPGLWDTVLNPHFFDPLSGRQTLWHDLEEQLATARDFQDKLDIARRFNSEQKFRAGVLMLEGIASASEVGLSLSNVCDVVLQQLLPAVEDEFALKHGRFEQAANGIAVIALGKYGGEELTHTSDLDLIYLYDAPNEDEFSNGKKPLSPKVYYSRLAQHITTALTALTPAGGLYEVDTRLRPSGNQGPLAVTIDTLADYYATSAWTWEFLALTRARIIRAPEGTEEKLRSAIHTALTSGPRTETLATDTLEMRRKLHTEFGTDSPWEVKHTHGGMVDIEFICQYLTLRHAAEKPDVINANVPGSIAALQAQGVIAPDEANTLTEAYEFMRRIQSLLRLCLPQVPTDADAIPAGLLAVLLKATHLSEASDIEDALRNTQKTCHELYRSLVCEQ